MWILDNPYNPGLLAFLGFVVGLAVFVAWIKAGKKELLYLLAMVVLLFVGLIGYERMHVSDREAIEATLQRLARELQANNREAIYDAIHPSAVDVLGQAKSELPQYTFEECRITKIHETEVNGDMAPKTAIVKFNVIAKGSFKQGGDIYPGTVPRYVELTMEQDGDGKWKVKGYRHDSPEASLRKEP
jgi:hypothetical protein